MDTFKEATCESITVSSTFVLMFNLFDLDNKLTGYSIYDKGYFNDECFEVKHDQPGLVGMCRTSNHANTNECQFYVTTNSPLSFMDN